MRIWELDDSGSGIYPPPNADQGQNSFVPDSNQQASYSPYEWPASVSYMPPTYGGYSIYGQYPQPQMAPPVPPGQGQFPNYNARPQQPFMPILPPDFMKGEDEEGIAAKYQETQAAFLGPTLLQQQMMQDSQQPPQQQNYPAQTVPPAYYGQPPNGPSGGDGSNANAILPVPATENVVTKETTKLNKRNQLLLMAILILALLIVASIVGLIVISVIAMPDQPIQEETTGVRFPLTRIDLQYAPELADQSTYSYLQTAVAFCDMVVTSYLKGTFTVNQCQVTQFSSSSSGSGLTANMDINVLNGDKPSDQVFLYVSSILVAKSDADVLAEPISANTIEQII